ncbi:MAG: serine/threonine protein kinase [Cyanothece sp. SIO2G6]|nr:serine/threonine protein kinase [Cyanothece sp. SIO2G6]
MSQQSKPSQLSRYRILGLVGQGQFGKVYCAIHRKTGKLFALKNLERERFPTHQFLRELRFLLSLQHPNIVTCHAVEHTATGRHLVMDYCEGGTLRSLMVDDVGLPLNQGMQLVMDVLQGLDEAHRQKIVHCDIKPENILLTLTAKGWSAKISDFGIARVNKEVYGRSAGNTGSPAYMAPERFYSQYSLVSDIYAVGVMMFELLVGHRPFTGTPKALMAAHLNQVVQFPETMSPDVPDALKEVVDTALQKLPARRFQSAREMLEAIHEAVKDTPMSPGQHSLRAEAPLLILRQVVPCYEGFPQQQTELSAPVTMLNGWQSRHTSPQAVSSPSSSPSPNVDETNATAYSQSFTRDNIELASKKQKADPCYIGYADDTQFCTQIYQRGRGEGNDNTGAGKGHSSEKGISLSFPLPEPIQQLLVIPQGYLLVTRRNILWVDRRRVEGMSLHHTVSKLQVDCPEPHQPSDPQVLAHPIYQLEQDCIAAVDPTGHWLGLVTDHRQSTVEGVSSTLSFHPLPQRSSSMALPQASVRLRAAGKAESLLEAIALDQRHIVIISDGPWRKTPSPEAPATAVPSPSAQSSSSMDRATYLEVFTRRGTRIAIQRLPMLLGKVIATPTPYCLLATDQYDPTSVLYIELKPFRIQRFALDIIPAFLMAASWGHIVADTKGKVIFLDPTGYAVSALQLPSPLMAATFIPPHFLFAATWRNGKGTLHTFDLKRQAIDWVF